MVALTLEIVKMERTIPGMLRLLLNSLQFSSVNTYPGNF